MRFTLLFIVLTCTLSVSAYENPFNSDNWWAKIPLEHEPVYTNKEEIDTSIIIISNRIMLKDTSRYMCEYKGRGTLRYFFVYAYQGKWHVLLTSGIQDALQHIPNLNKDWVVYTEGMGKIFPTNIHRSMMMASQYNVNVISLDYPSITTTKTMLGNYFFAIKNARNVYEDFYPVINEIKQLKEDNQLGTKKLTLFFHSMGNYVLREIAKRKYLDNINDTKWVDNIILNAACVPEKDHADWLSKVWFAERIYVQYNPKDKVLKGATLAGLTKQLGRNVEYPIVTKATYINFNTAIAERHSNFLNLYGRMPVTPVVKQHYHTLIHGQEADLSNEKIYATSPYQNIGMCILSKEN